VEAGSLVGSARGSAGLTVRELAARAGVAGSTITRIQAGVVDPTIRTLVRVLDAAGYELQISAARTDAERLPRLTDLVGAWTRRAGEVRLDWPRWRGLLDSLAMEPELVPEAIYPSPPPAGDRIVDTLLAAVAEKLADDGSLPRPRWSRAVPPLDAPYRPAVVQAHKDRPIPRQLRDRGLLIDAGSLWRDPATIGT
jgi:transcriptional regulator with XRE-family HTH domain